MCSEIGKRKSIISALSWATIATVIVAVLLFYDLQLLQDPFFLAAAGLLLIVGFITIAYWSYKEIEYSKRKYGDSKRILINLFWRPTQTFGEGVYYHGLVRFTLGVPIVVLLLIVFIFGSSIEIGIVSAIISFMICLFLLSKLHHRLEEKSIQKESDIYHPTRSKLTTNQKAAIALILFILALIVIVPFASQMARQNFISSSEQNLFGTWQNYNQSVTIVFQQDHTCSAVYEDETYSGTWQTGGFGGIEVAMNWNPQFRMPHPNDPSYMMPINTAYLIEDGEILSLYSYFNNPPEFELIKI